MTHPAPAPGDAMAPMAPRPGTWMAALEIVASFTAFFAMGGLFVNRIFSTLSFGPDPSPVTPRHVTNYHQWLVLLAFAVTCSFGLALWRRGFAARSLWWHGLVLVAACASASAFHVAVAVPSSPHPPVNHPSGPVCYSGSNNCPGG